MVKEFEDYVFFTSTAERHFSDWSDTAIFRYIFRIANKYKDEYKIVT